jgi:hypothetical protein
MNATLTNERRAALDRDLLRMGKVELERYLAEKLALYQPTHEHPSLAVIRSRERARYADALAYVRRLHSRPSAAPVGRSESCA